MPEPTSTRSSTSVVNACSRQASSHSATPTSASAGSGLRRSNTRAPHQVSAKEPNSTALAKSIDSESGTEPCRPSSMIEPARIRWALPHQASARLLKFCAQAKNNNRPSMISMCIVTMKSVLTSRSIAISDNAVLALSGMRRNYRVQRNDR
jgi:hypothetical protein